MLFQILLPLILLTLILYSSVVLPVRCLVNEHGGHELFKSKRTPIYLLIIGVLTMGLGSLTGCTTDGTTIVEDGKMIVDIDKAKQKLDQLMVLRDQFCSVTTSSEETKAAFKELQTKYTGLDFTKICSSEFDSGVVLLKSLSQ